jgi:hypothetical protein
MASAAGWKMEGITAGEDVRSGTKQIGGEQVTISVHVLKDYEPRQTAMLIR